MAESSLALTRTTGGQAKPVPEVPAFLNKLYQMIDEPTTDDIIHWADDGESFYILSQDELQRNVLPHWFKHNKFTSFVRQLNMYGFHKMQQMKQGALKNAADEEVWQFHEPNFRRGRLDLLKLITRKKTAGGSAKKEDDADTFEFINDGERLGGGGGMNATFNSSSNGNNTSGTAAALARSTSGRSAAELSNISEQLQLIKRSQSNILSDLKTLQLSNNQLWKEMMANQAMQKKQQDTIDRIIKFLSGVFGNHRAQQAHAHAGRGGADDVRSGTQSPSPRLSGRPLLIANGATSPGKALVRRQNSNPLPPVDDHRFTEANSPSDNHMIVDTHSPYIEELDVKTPTSPSDQAASSLVSFRPPTRPPSRLGRTPSSTDATSGGASSNADFPTLTEILNSPNLLMAALAQMQSQGTLDPLAFPGDPNLDYMNQAGMPNGSSSTTTPSNLAPIPSTSAPNQYPYFPPSASNPATLNPDLTHQLSNPSDPSDPNSALFFPYDNSAALAHQTENLGQTIDAAVGVQNGIERSQIDVNSLMRELLRLDPNAFSIPGDGGGGGATLSELSNGDVDMSGARLEDLGARDDAMMNEIGLPSVDSAITNANANASANTNGVNNVGHNINGTAPNYETFFNSLGDANSRANANNANSYVPPSASGPALSTIEAFDPSQFLTAEAFGTPEPPDHRTSAPLAPAPIPQLFSTSLFADANPLSTTNSGTGYIPPRRTVVPLPTRASTRPKRKSDVAVSYAENDDDEDEDDLDGSADGGPPPSKKTKRKRR